ncbi:hypothetical protein BAY59_38450 (plasmid) [Prauserella coralliicola]|nr:hypothetical protein BAY59_38450 [Prauserella coralliicola]
MNERDLSSMDARLAAALATGNERELASVAGEAEAAGLPELAGVLRSRPAAELRTLAGIAAAGQEDRELTDVIEEHLPYDGPHSRDTVIAAAHGVSYLIRYLNNATQSGTARHTLAWANTIDATVSSVKAAVYGMDQLLEQLSAAAAAAAEDPTLYDAQSAAAERAAEGARVARELAARLDEMRSAVVTWEGFRCVGGLARQLEDAHSLSARLGNITTDD